MENNMIDSHKLTYHPAEVARWLNGEMVYPINAEVCLWGGCNHRCAFCCYDFVGYKPVGLEKELFLKTVLNMQERGLKSILFAGTGEPLLHPDFCEIVNRTRNMGIDLALSTNGVLYVQEKIEKTLSEFAWIRFSVSAGCEKTYKSIQRGRDGDFNRVLNNIHTAADYKAKHNLDVVLNVQLVMVPENFDEIILLAKQVKECGADVFVVKSVGWNTKTQSSMRNEIKKEFFLGHDDLVKQLSDMNDDDFQTVYRKNRIENELQERCYDECYAAPFHVCIEANGNVCQCCNMQGIDDCSFGNLHESNFMEIWEGTKRKKFLEKIKNDCLKECPKACKLAVMNNYLYQLKHPNKHVNFI